MVYLHCLRWLEGIFCKVSQTRRENIYLRAEFFSEGVRGEWPGDDKKSPLQSGL
jgi:hypothetical protein